jgi:NTE family protein
MARPKIGLALSSGAAKGFAHIGVLKVLKEEQIPIDFLAGSSMGSFVGVFFANGIDLEVLEHLAVHLSYKHWVDLSYPRLGFMNGEKIMELIQLLTQRKNLEDLPIPTAVVATDLITGKPVVFREGPIDTAVRASISIPGIFEPVPWKDTLLVDGGVVDRLPISLVREMGADFVIAVDVLSLNHHRTQIRNFFDVITQTLGIMEREILLSKKITADFLIRPPVGDLSPTAFHRAKEFIRRGEEEARAQIGKLKSLLASWQGEEKNEHQTK